MAGYTRQSAANIITGGVIFASDINAEFNQLQSAFSGSTGHAHDGTTGNGPQISLTSSISGTLPIANGGTAATTAAAARTSLFGVSTTVDNTIARYDGTTGLLQQSGVTIDDSNQLTAVNLSTNGVAGTSRQLAFLTSGSARWLVIANSTAEGGSNAGSDFSIIARTDTGSALSTPFSIVRSTGVVTINSLSLTTPLAITEGGTGAASASAARTALGLGTSATVNTGTSGATIPLLNGTNTWSATQTFSNVTISAGSITGITDLAVADGGTGASTAAGARTNLGAASSGANSDITSITGLSAPLAVNQGGTGSTTASGARANLGVAGGNLPATATNDSATAGNLGEYIQSEIPVGGAVSISSGVAKSVTSISLTAGDWDVWGSIVFGPAGTTVMTGASGFVHTVVDTAPAAPNGGAYNGQFATFATGSIQVVPVGLKRVSLASTTTIYITAFTTFTTSTNTVYGGIYARRVR